MDALDEAIELLVDPTMAEVMVENSDRDEPHPAGELWIEPVEFGASPDSDFSTRTAVASDVQLVTDPHATSRLSRREETDRDEVNPSPALTPNLGSLQARLAVVEHEHRVRTSVNGEVGRDVWLVESTTHASLPRFVAVPGFRSTGSERLALCTSRIRYTYAARSR
jgi:hypothetical protein